MRVTALILAGGASRRMGRDKLSLPRRAGGTDRVIDHVVDVARTAASRVVLAVPPGGFGGPVPALVELVPDPAWHQGPLSALAHAWPAAVGGGADTAPGGEPAAGAAAGFACEPGGAGTAVLVLAGDLPGIDPAVPASLRAALAGAEADAAVVVRGGVDQPLIGLYTESSGAVFQRMARTGQRRLLPALTALRVVRVDADAMGWPEWWTRPVHTPADYEAWLRHTEGWA
ncbi:NTP transferase domain-containing protein [Alicyclobacillus sp.]|uniref:molybdenum cofactor guanylyltransferase n=1 Tax=Alicyclobacillus sp. TaxID=61169 RepID=UPI0025C6AB40|nr:NTP transferase domain-containing protein [Alicyclobacillus sp.]MCL6517912.1 NTP transferase domain-containing protein [Alicyclobacillus sp.]